MKDTLRPWRLSEEVAKQASQSAYLKMFSKHSHPFRFRVDISLLMAGNAGRTAVGPGAVGQCHLARLCVGMAAVHGCVQVALATALMCCDAVMTVPNLASSPTGLSKQYLTHAFKPYWLLVKAQQ